MNLLFMQNGLPPYGITRSGLVSIIDPWRDTYGRNILPVGSENLAWSVENVASVRTGIPPIPNGYASSGILLKETTYTGTHDLYATVINAKGQLTFSILAKAKDRTKIFLMSVGPTFRANYDLSNGTIISVDSGATATITPVGDWYLCTITISQATADYITFVFGVLDSLGTFSYTGDGVSGAYFSSPQANFGQLYPYAPPSGLPQSLTDYSGHGNTFQLGSAAGSDTNDPAWSGNGLAFSTDDYAKSSSPAFDDMQAFTCITVLNSASYTTWKEIFWKNERKLEINTTGNMQFVQKIGTIYFGATTYNSMVANKPTIVGMSYNAITSITPPKIYIDNVKQMITTVNAVPGQIVSDKDTDLFIGNLATAGQGVNGTIYLQAWYNRVLPDAEYMQAYNGLRRLMSARGVVI